MAQPTLQEITATPQPLEVNGKSITIHPLTLDDVAAWDLAAQRNFLKAAALDELVPDDKSFAAQSEHRRQVCADARRICLGSIRASGPMWTAAGMLEAVRLSLLHGDGLTTAASVQQLLAGRNARETLANVRKVATAVYAVSGFIEEVHGDPKGRTLYQQVLVE